MNIYPDEKGGEQKKVLALLKGGGTTSFGVVFTWYLEGFAKFLGVRKQFLFFKRGRAKSITLF